MTSFGHMGKRAGLADGREMIRGGQTTNVPGGDRWAALEAARAESIPERYLDEYCKQYALGIELAYSRWSNVT